METLERNQDLPDGLVAKAALLPRRGDLILPGTILAIMGAPIFPRSEGCLRKRSVDIGDRVRTARLLALIEAPEVDKQVQQAQARSDEVLAESQYAKAQNALERATGQTIARHNIQFDEALSGELRRPPSPASSKP